MTATDSAMVDRFLRGALDEGICSLVLEFGGVISCLLTVAGFLGGLLSAPAAKILKSRSSSRYLFSPRLLK